MRLAKLEKFQKKSENHQKKGQVLTRYICKMTNIPVIFIKLTRNRKKKKQINILHAMECDCGQRVCDTKEKVAKQAIQLEKKTELVAFITHTLNVIIPRKMQKRCRICCNARRNVYI